MKKLFRKWRGVPVAIAIASSTLAAHAAVQVKTLGGGPNEISPSRSGLVNGDTLRQAKFNNPFSIAVDTNGNLYVADKSNNKLRKITKPGAADSLTSTFASKLPGAAGVAVDSANLVYVVTQNDGRLRVFTSGGSLVRTVSGLVKPTALALDGSGNVYVTENVGNVKVITPDDSTFLVTSGFGKLRGIAVLPSGLLAVSESDNHAIHLVDPNDGSTVLLAGGNGRGFADGDAASARFDQPHGLALAPDGSLVIADRFNHRVRVINSSNVVSTLYGIDKKQWANGFPGWADGDSGTAAAREPLGLTVAKNGTVYVGEGSWDLIRQATGGAFGATNPPNSGNATNIIVDGTNIVSVVGTNVISFGFESGEASSSFVGAAGQKFYAPITLFPAPGQKIYTFQMSLSVTGETGVALNPSESHFVSMLDKKAQVITRDPSIPFDLPQVFTTNIFYVPITNNIVFRNDTINMLGVGWLTRYEKTNLYDTLAQDLITYSIAKDTLLGSDIGKVVLGAYGVRIPNSATTSDSFLVAISNPSGTADGVTRPVNLTIPTNGSMSNGAPNAIKRLTISSRLYVVGDSTPFGWFNAGDFGDTNLANSDVMDAFQAAEYHLNKPILDSDLFNAMDSSDGSYLGGASDLFNGDLYYTAALINSITTGDGTLNVDDVFVTFRRSLDPTLKWYARYWSNGALQVVEVPNTLAGGAGSKSVVALRKTAKAKSIAARPALSVAVDDVLTTPGSVLQLPIRVQVGEPYALRTMLLNVTVEALDGSPAIEKNVQMQMAPALGAPDLSDSHGVNNMAGAWLDNQITGITGNSVLAILTVHVPAGAGPRAAYRVHFDHFSASPNGIALFDSRVRSSLILLSDRSTSTWGDGIADEWRLRHFGSIHAPESGPGADADGDGVINSIEYANETDPTNSTSN